MFKCLIANSHTCHGGGGAAFAPPGSLEPSFLSQLSWKMLLRLAQTTEPLCPATVPAAFHRLRQELTFNLNLSRCCASGSSQVCYVAGCNSSLGSDHHPPGLPTSELPRSFADSFSFFSPSFPSTLPSLPFALLPQPHSRVALPWSWSCFTVAGRSLYIVWPFRTEVMGATDSQHPPQLVQPGGTAQRAARQ